MKQLKLLLTVLFLAVLGLGNVWAKDVTYSFTIQGSDFNTTSYAANNSSHDFTAACTTDGTKTMTVACTSNQVMKNSNNMQWQKNNGYIYNTTDLKTIKSVTVNSSAGSFTTYYGTTEHPTSGTTVGNGFFTVKVGNATGTTSSIVVVFEVTEDDGNPDPEPTCSTPTITFAEEAVEKLTTDAAFTNAASVEFESTATGQTISWSVEAGKEGVATVNATTGEVTIVGVGEAKIYASVAADGDYCEKSASYTLTVTEPAFEGTIVTMSKEESADIKFVTGSSAAASAVWANSTPLSAKGITLSGAVTSGTNYSYYDGSVVRFYTNNTLTITPASGVTIVKIEIVRSTSASSNTGTISCDNLTASSSNTSTNTNVYTGSTTSAVAFTNNAQARFTEIKVYYTGAPAEVYLSSIAIKNAPTKLAYNNGNFFDPAGLVITKTMSDGTTEDVAYAGNESDFTFSPALDAALTLDDAEVSIIYGGKTVKQAISVTFAAAPGTYEIATNNALWGTNYSGTASGVNKVSGTKYGVSIELNKSGNEMYITDAQTRAYTGYTMKFTAPVGYEFTALTFTADGTNWAGTHEASVGTMTDNKHWTGNASEVTITFKGTCRCVKVAATYAVPATLQSVTVSGTPSKVEYVAGENFDPAGLTVTGNYSDESHKTITEGITWSTPAALTAGQTSVEITATVAGVTSAAFEVTGLTVEAAKNLDHITLNTDDVTKVFWKGETFNYTNLVVTAHYDDESSKVVDPLSVSTPDMTLFGEAQTITVSYKEADVTKEATYEITVKTISNTKETAYTATEAIALVDAGKDLSTLVYVKGTVTSASAIGTYGNSNIFVTDGEASFEFYRCLDLGNVKFTSDYVKAEDEVVAYGKLTKFNSTYEFGEGCYLVDYTSGGGTTPTYASLAELVAAGAPTSTGTLVKVTLTDEVITDIDNAKKLVKFLSGSQEVVTYVNATVPAEWVKGGTISAELECTWKLYSGMWELCPAAWSDLNYTAPTTYTITCATDLEHGTVSADATEAAAGVVVTLSETHEAGYQLEAYSVVDAESNPVAVVDGKFTMPASNVTVSATFVEKVLPVWATTYTSNVTLSTTGGTSVTASKVKVNGEETQYDAIKAGTGSNDGKIKVTLPLGTTKLHFHAVTWDGSATTATLSIKKDGDDTELFGNVIRPNTGLSSNSPYTLVGDPTDDYYCIDFGSALTEATTVVFDASVNRFGIYGVNVEKVEVELLSIAVSGTPTKLSYYKGQTLATAGLVVTGTYSLGAPQTITEGIEWTIDPEVFATAGTVSANVTAKVGEIASAPYTVENIEVSLPTITGDEVSIVFPYDGKYYALPTNSFTPVEVAYINGKLLNVAGADQANLIWYKNEVENKVTFQTVDGDYLTGGGNTTISRGAAKFEWSIDEDGHYVANSRTFLMRSTTDGPTCKNYGTTNATNSGYSDFAILATGFANADAVIGNTAYETLAAAFEAVGQGETIEMICNCSGNGIVVPEGSNFTVDFGGFTYTVTGPELAGSNGTKNQCFQLLKNSTITFQNGAIVADNAAIKMIIQNYANLTLNNMVLDATVGENNVGYVCSNNNGNTVITGGTEITAKAGGVAFDVCSFGSYTGANVTVNNATINGNIEVSATATANTSNLALTLTAGTVTGDLVMEAGADKATITKEDAVSVDAPEGYKWVNNELIKKSTDATLSDLKVAGETVDGFNAATEEYTVELPYGTTVVPVVTATATSEFAAEPVVTDATALPGATTVVVTAEDGTTTKTYTVNFTLAAPEYELIRTTTVGKIITMCQAKAINALQGAIAYEVEKKNGVGIDLVEAQFPLVAGKPYILEATATEIKAIRVGEEATEDVDDANGLVGNRSNSGEAQKLLPNGEGYYIFLNNHICAASGLNGNYVAPDRAYLNMNAVGTISAAPGRRRITMTTDATTGMMNILDNDNVNKMLINGQLYIIRGGKMFNAAGQLVK